MSLVLIFNKALNIVVFMKMHAFPMWHCYRENYPEIFEGFSPTSVLVFYFQCFAISLRMTLMQFSLCKVANKAQQEQFLGRGKMSPMSRVTLPQKRRG